MAKKRVYELSPEALEARREYYRQWRKNNPEKTEQYQKNTKKKAPEYNRDYLREWRKKNPDKERDNKKRYWTKKAAAMHQQNSDHKPSDAPTIESKSE